MSVNSNRPESTGASLAAGARTIAEALDQPVTLRDQISREVLDAILVELRILNFLVADAFGSRADVVQMRSDPSFMARG